MRDLGLLAILLPGWLCPAWGAVSARSGGVPVVALPLPMTPADSWAGPDLTADLSSAFHSARTGLTSEVPEIGAAEAVPQAQGQQSGWVAGGLDASDGARIEYRYRPGVGPAILLVHGRSFGGEVFDGWFENFFPRRPLVAVNRRGYSPSTAGDVDETSVGGRNAGDIAHAIEFAYRLGGGRRVGVVAVSLGAMVLPELDPEKVAWLALINPGVPGMLKHLEPDKAVRAWALWTTYQSSRLWLPAARAEWIRQVSQMMYRESRERLRQQAAGESQGLSENWLRLLLTRLEDSRFQELLVQETLWVFFGSASIPRVAGIPVLLGLSLSDELIPGAAWDELVEKLQAGGSPLRVVRWPGRHITPLLENGPAVRELEAFDREVLQ